MIWKLLGSIFISDNIVRLLKNISDDRKKFLQDSQKLLLELCKKFKHRYTISPIYLQLFKCFNPINALIHFRFEYPNLDELFFDLPLTTNNYEPVTMIRINEEWTDLPLYRFNDDITHETELCIFWLNIGKCRSDK